jgi:HEAT repeat protein
MNGVTLVLIAASFMLAVGVLTVLAWFISTAYLDRVERRLASRKGLYRELVSGLATRDRALLEPTIHQMKTLYDLDALEAVLEEHARVATGRPGWLVEVYDQLGLVDKYIEKLRTARKWRERAFAAELLGRVGSAKAVPALLETVQATKTEDADVREIALRALARIADPGAVEPLVRALATAEAWLAPRIADILARHGEVVAEPLIRLLEQSDRHLARAWAANVLGEVRAQDVLPALVRGLADPDDEVRAKSATALGRLGDRRAVGPLLDHLLSDPAPFVRTRIACTLGQFRDPEVVNRLVQALGDSAWWVRMRSVEALEQIGAPAEGPLLVALDDPDPELRGRAAVALERLGVSASLVQRIERGEEPAEASEALLRLINAGTRELLVELLGHSSPEVRQLVIAAIGQAKRRDLGAELAQVATADADPRLRAQALDVLRELRSGEGRRASRTAAAEADPRVRRAAITLLGEQGGPDSIEMLRFASGDPDPEVRVTAARALGKIGLPAAQAELHRLLSDPNPAVREAAAAATADAGFHSLVPAVAELLNDEEEAIRIAAVHALGRLGDPSVLPALRHGFAGASAEMHLAILQAVGRLEASALGELIESLMGSAEASGRLTVARTVAQSRPRNAIQLLSRLWRDPEPSVRAAALDALGQCARFQGPPPADVVQAIADGLRDSEEIVRAAAVEICGRLGLHDFDSTLLTLIQHDSSVAVREGAAISIGLLRAPGGEESLLAAFRRNEPAQVRAAAVMAAGVFARDSVVTRVIELPEEREVRGVLRERLNRDARFRLLRRKMAPATRHELVALAAGDMEEAQLSLRSGMHRVLDAGERVRLISGLRAFQGEQSQSALLQAVRSDPNPEVRTAALEAVSDMLDADDLLAFGSRALGDPSILVRRRAAELFSKLPPARAFPRLLRDVRVDDDSGVLAAVAALAERHFMEFRDAVLALPTTDRRLVLVARISRHLHHPELPALLPTLAASGEPEVRHAVAELWMDRPELADSSSLESLTVDPVAAVRHVAAGVAAAAKRYDLLERMTEDPDSGIRRQVAITLGRTAPPGSATLGILDRLAADSDMPVRAAAYAARLLQGIPVPLPPALEPRVAADAVREAGSLSTLREIARSSPTEDRRLAAALALALLQDEVAGEVARSDPVPSIRHRVGGAIELTLPSPGGEPR